MAVGARQHVVVLVPGFLDFAPGAGSVLTRAGERGEANARVAGILRAALEAHCGLPIPVVSLPASNACNFATRQRQLLRHLEALDGALRGVRQFHLVGHGPGGVDAELLTATLPLKTGATWHDLDPSHLRERVTSVLTIGAPHYGTHLAEQPLLAGRQRPQSLDMQGLRQVAGVASSLIRELLTRLRRPRRDNALGALPLMFKLLREGTLMSELMPHSMQALRAHNPPDPALEASVQSIVVSAPELTTEEGGVLRQPDRLFAALHSLTGSRSLVDAPLALVQAQKLLRGVSADRVVRHPSARVPAFDLSANDGIVNAVRQLLTTRTNQEHALAALVIADHADVLGYYDRRSPLAPELCQRGGLFRSGAHFGDDEFFHLWGLVAAHIASVAIGEVAPSSTEIAAQ
ncbi:MAG: hypothetical protein QM778_35750 [Myxococcales bacterium]